MLISPLGVDCTGRLCPRWNAATHIIQSLDQPIEWVRPCIYRSVLELNLATLKKHKLILEGKADAKVVLPVTEPDPDLAENILSDILSQADVLAEAEGAGDLVGALAQTRVLTEKLSMALLRMAYFQAAYGVTFPKLPNIQTPASPETPHLDTGETLVQGEPVEILQPEWADPDYPEIDYAAQPFPSLAADGSRFVGWWAIEDDQSEIDDSPEMIAVNISALELSSFSNSIAFVASCREHELNLVYFTGEFILGDWDSSTLSMVVRLDDKPARREKWSELTTNKGAGLFGRKVLPFMRELARAKEVFLRLEQRRNAPIDTTFRLSGSSKSLEMVANTCGETIVELDRELYRNVQESLATEGFYNAHPDGVWGAVSKRAMRAFQKNKGLPVTGVPDQDTLQALGFDID